MIEIRLSILIPSIPSRFAKSVKLYRSLVEMSKGMDIEIIMLTDNKLQSIGEKQNNLKSMVRGKYFCFLHDDDHFTSLTEMYNATLQNVDVICFKALCYNSDGSTYVVTQQLCNKVEHNTLDGRYLDCNRPPFPNCLWANKFKRYNFPNISYSEDWVWVKKCLKNAKSEHFIDEILFSYNFNPKKTEASTETNTHWTNPNEKSDN